MQHKLEELAHLGIPAKEIVQEDLWGIRALGSHSSTMTLYRQGDHVSIEWDVPTLGMTEHIGLELDDNLITGYDGIMTFPRPAIPWLKSLGYTFEGNEEDY